MISQEIVELHSVNTKEKKAELRTTPMEGLVSFKYQKTIETTTNSSHELEARLTNVSARDWVLLSSRGNRLTPPFESCSSRGEVFRLASWMYCHSPEVFLKFTLTHDMTLRSPFHSQTDRNTRHRSALTVPVCASYQYHIMATSL